MICQLSKWKSLICGNNTCFRVPQVLLYFGILEYSNKLTETLKQGIKVHYHLFYTCNW